MTDAVHKSSLNATAIDKLQATLQALDIICNASQLRWAFRLYTVSEWVPQSQSILASSLMIAGAGSWELGRI